MRTTLTVDDGIDRELRESAGRRGVSYREEVNRVLRAGLDALHRPPPKRYRLKPKSMGRLSGVDYDKVGQLADELDDRERVRSGDAAH